MFDKSIISREGKKVTVKCAECGKIGTKVAKEHKRTCIRQSKHTDKYLCYRCLMKTSSMRKLREENDKKFKTKEWRDACRERSIASRTEETKRKYRDYINNRDKKEFSAKISRAIKKKFENDPEYVAKVKKARKAYWKDPEYVKIQKELNEKHKKNNTGIYGNNDGPTWIERALYSKCEQLSIKFISQYKVGYYKFDCFLPDYNILIECNGNAPHKDKVNCEKFKRNISNDRSKATFIENNHPHLKLKVIWEDDFMIPKRLDDLLELWTGKKIEQIDFDLKDVKMKEIDNYSAVSFIQKYHYSYSLGKGRSQLRYGAFLGDVLIAVACYASATRAETAIRLGIKQQQIRELVRLCCHPAYQKKNLMSFVLSKSVKMLRSDRSKIICLVTFADTTFGHDGTVYKASNWKLDGTVPKSYWYVNKEGYVMHKKTLYNHARKLSKKEAEYAKENNYVRVWGKEKLRYILWLK